KELLGEQHPDTALSLSNLGALLWRQGDHAGARPLFEQALQVTRRNLDLAAAALSERQQLAMQQALHPNLNAFLSLAARASVPAAPVYEPVLAWKGAALVRQRQLRQARRHPDLAPLVADLQATSGRLATLAFATTDPKRAAERRKNLAGLTERKEQLEREL